MQSRYAMAEQELLKCIAQEPDEFMYYGYLAMTLAQMDREAEALKYAERAVELAPEEEFGFFVLAQVLSRLERLNEAQEAIDHAIALDPHDAAAHGLQSEIYGQRGQWDKALAAADIGLGLDPESDRCVNARVDALIRLNRPDEAKDTAAQALVRAPGDSLSHCNMGWALLHKNEPAQAMEHFKESLRLNPQMSASQEGIIETLRARSLIYRWILVYNLWCLRTSLTTQLIVFCGLFIGMQVLVRLNLSGFAGVAVSVARGVLLVALLVVILSTQTYNLVLRSDPLGRLALGEEQRRDTNWFALGVVLIAGMIIAAFVDDRRSDAIEYLLLLMALGPTLDTPRNFKFKRAFMATATVGLMGLALWHSYAWCSFEWTFDRNDPAAIRAHLKENPGFAAFVLGQALIRKVILWGGVGVLCVGYLWDTVKGR